jgi:ribosomal protein S18 acetylase RimI-like enzyme
MSRFSACTKAVEPGLWTEISELEWRAERGVFSYTMSHVARLDGDLVGLLISYTAQRETETDWSLGSSRPRIGASRLEQLHAVRRLSMFLFPALPKDAYYVQNIATHSSVRGRKGLRLGRRLMEFAFALGRAEKCRSCHLDVNSATPAVGFYEHLGMRVLVRTEVPGLVGIPVHSRMVIDL